MGLLLCVCGESKPSKPARSARVWHEAGTEEDCGNFTSLYSDEKPSELCTEVEINTTVCLCTTRDTTIKETETIVNTEFGWKLHIPVEDWKNRIQVRRRVSEWSSLPAPL